MEILLLTIGHFRSSPSRGWFVHRVIGLRRRRERPTWYSLHAHVYFRIINFYKLAQVSLVIIDKLEYLSAIFFFQERQAFVMPSLSVHTMNLSSNILQKTCPGIFVARSLWEASGRIAICASFLSNSTQQRPGLAIISQSVILIMIII